MSWLEIPDESPFSIANLPLGIISYEGSPGPRPAVAIGDNALDLLEFAHGGGFSGFACAEEYLHVFSKPTLNDIAALGTSKHSALRRYIQQVLELNTPVPTALKDNESLRRKALIPLARCTMHLPMHIGDYTDFYAGLNHAYNVGVLFRGHDNALQPNYKHIPVGYHGRASSVVVSGTPVRRPIGQILPDPASSKTPVLEPCRKLDIELELGAFVCGKTTLGERIPIDQAEQHIFGYVLMNDWSARDIQAWEYVPLGLFLSKSFATTISPWVVLPDALEPFRAQGLEAGDRDALLPYLRESENSKNCFDIKLSVDLIPAGASAGATEICKTDSTNLLYSFTQMLTHHSVNGCPMNDGDLLGSGTISGVEAGSQGSLLEQTANGKNAIRVGETSRMFLEDGDEVVIRGVCGEPGGHVGFGECRGTIVPSTQ